MPAEAAALFTAVYTKGLGRVRVPQPAAARAGPDRRACPARAARRPRRSTTPTARPLSAVGGGKDSIVTLEILRAAGLDPVPFSVNPNPVIVNVNAASGLPALAARRQLDPRLFELNKAGRAATATSRSPRSTR